MPGAVNGPFSHNYPGGSLFVSFPCLLLEAHEKPGEASPRRKSKSPVSPGSGYENDPFHVAICRVAPGKGNTSKSHCSLLFEGVFFENLLCILPVIVRPHLWTEASCCFFGT